VKQQWNNPFGTDNYDDNDINSDGNECLFFKRGGWHINEGMNERKETLASFCTYVSAWYEG